MKSSLLLILVIFSFHWSKQASAFFVLQSAEAETRQSPFLQSTSVCAKKKDSKKKPISFSSSVKGFGAALSVSTRLDRTKEAQSFYVSLEQQGISLHGTALGFFNVGEGITIRGVAALQDFKKGDVLINIPYEAAVNLGLQGDDPTEPAMDLLIDYCNVMRKPENARYCYYSMLPPYGGPDCLGSTDFFSEHALEALQSPLTMEETLQRRQRTRQRLDTAKSNQILPSWIDGTELTEEHLRWAVWLVTSRVLTVQGHADDTTSYRLLIPYLDMCNHDRSSLHVLTGRAVPGGQLKVVAGTIVKVGDQINICYGAGVIGNDRFTQDYGFLDPSEDAFRLVAQQLLGKVRVSEGPFAGKNLPEADRERTLARIRSTSLASDQTSLEQERDPALRCALQYRIGLKKALSKFIVMP